MKIYLDDVRPTPIGWTAAKNFSEFKALIDGAQQSGEPIEAVSFDNDLGEGEPEGYDVTKWLAEHHPECIVGEGILTVHSANPVARQAIEGFITSCRKHREILLERKTQEPPEIKISRLP